jgi:ABC-type dipeptide/oligopeptide/nickel transport system permease component
LGRFIARRLLLAIPVLIGASFIVFALVYALPGDPIRALAGDRPLSPAVIAELRDRYNLDDPLVVQYLKYLGGLVQGDLGVDFSGRSVSETIAQRLPVTLRLAVAAIIIEAVIGVLAGVMAGIRRNGFLDNLVLISTTLLVSIPVFVLAFTVQYFIGVKTGILPISGLTQGWRSYVLPGLCLAALSLAYVARLTRTSIVENLRNDYVRTARGQGAARAHGDRQARPAQQPHPGGHLPRRGLRRADERRDHHRGHLQPAGPRRRRLPSRAGPGGRARRGRHHLLHLRLHLLQPARGRPVRRPRPPDPL